MGGKALKNINTVRLTKEDYLVHKQKIFKLLNSISDNFHFIEVPYITEKEDFGDMDIIYYSDNGKGLDKDTFYDLFNDNGSGEVIKNGNVISVSYPIGDNINFQLDFIYIDKKDVPFNLFYLSYNDVGNLLGRIASSLNLKLKNNGLFYRFSDFNNKSKFYADILITDNVEEALKALGYNPYDYFSKIDKGFKNKQDVYDFVIKSKYFTIDHYLSDNQNSKHRKRDKKRETYSEFVSYLKTIDNKNLIKEIDNDYIFNQLKINFPIFKENYNIKVEELKINKIFKEKFNGGIVASITGYSGENLGKFIQSYKQNFTNEKEFKEFIINNNEDDIEKSIIIFLSLYV